MEKGPCDGGNGRGTTSQEGTVNLLLGTKHGVMEKKVGRKKGERENANIQGGGGGEKTW